MLHPPLSDQLIGHEAHQQQPEIHDIANILLLDTFEGEKAKT